MHEREKGRSVCLFRAVRRGKGHAAKPNCLRNLPTKSHIPFLQRTRGPREGEVDGKDYFFIYQAGV